MACRVPGKHYRQELTPAEAVMQFSDTKTCRANVVNAPVKKGNASQSASSRPDAHLSSVNY